ncbi:hypothetical protein B7494_g2192 [Chlorociboria aeruginascens]|nr:hypothetical protein B7494_g2192 [Chlorociboria aeruginascens]
MSSKHLTSRLAQVLVDFAELGNFPDEEALSAGLVDDSVIPIALQDLADSKARLENEIQKLGRNIGSDVDSWIVHATDLQDDIEQSRKLASEIVRQAEADEERIEALEEQSHYVQFLLKEQIFNAQLGEALHSLQQIRDHLDSAERVATDGRIIDALLSLENAARMMADIPIDRTTRAWRILDERCYTIQESIHEQVHVFWTGLIYLNFEERSLTINEKLTVTLDQVVTALGLFHELETAAQRLWADIDAIIITPRIDTSRKLYVVHIQEGSLKVGTEPANTTIESLLVDLDAIIQFLIKNIPPQFMKCFSDIMVPIVSARLKRTWLDKAVPATLTDMDTYHEALIQVENFARKLDTLQCLGTDELHEWVVNAPKIWLGKRRESNLEWIRNELSLGIGATKSAERIEKRVVAREEGINVSSNANMVVEDGWDEAWQDDDEDLAITTGKNRHSLDEERRASEISVSSETQTPLKTDSEEPEEDEADAWGWGDDDMPETEPTHKPEVAAPKKVPFKRKQNPDFQNVTLSERYWISAMPYPVFKTIKSIYDDGATLMLEGSPPNPVTPAAAGLFNIPALILAMYRATSPHYYAGNQCGNLYAYNDSLWLCDQLRDFSASWRERPGLVRRAYGMVKLDGEIKSLENFGKRAYGQEMTTQRTIINDLLGGAQNFLSQETSTPTEREETVDTVVDHIKSMSKLWKPILTESVWASAVGSLVNAVASKIIKDIFDLSDMGVDEAEKTAKLISQVTKLDSLFLPTSPKTSYKSKSGKAPNPHVETTSKLPMTAQYADKWLKLHFLSEVLQSNLKDIRFLWFESELSLHFTRDEVVDLINLSFENNPGVRQTIKDIREKRAPKDDLDVEE